LLTYASHLKDDLIISGAFGGLACVPSIRASREHRKVPPERGSATAIRGTWGRSSKSASVATRLGIFPASWSYPVFVS